MIVVFGGTGHFGRHIVRHLVGQRIPTRILSRNRTRAREIFTTHPEIVEGDVTDISTIRLALEGASGVVISLSAFTPGLIHRWRAIERDAVLSILEVMQERGIRRLVYLSGYELRLNLIEELKLEMGRVKLEIEESIMASDLDWTLLGVPPSMMLFYSLIHGHYMIVPGGGPPALPCVSPIDIGAIAGQAVMRMDLNQMRIRTPGPEALSFQEAAMHIALAIDKKIDYKAVPLFPLAVASKIARLRSEYLAHLVASIKLMNRFPQDLVESSKSDHEWLLRKFDYVPKTLEEDAIRYFRTENA